MQMADGREVSGDALYRMIARQANALAGLFEAERLFQSALLTGALATDAAKGSDAPFDPRIHTLRKHKGQIATAQALRELLAGSAIRASHLKGDERVQDPYCLRCQPQVMGAAFDVMRQAATTLAIEANGVSDNPLVFTDTNEALSGGNFHGEPLAIALDYLGIAMSELASISERRTFQLISGKGGLPKFLVEDSGLNSGMMIPQYTAASIVSMNKQLATPASVDTITSSDGQEDHVSMGANAAVKTYKIVYNIEKVLAIEFMTAMQALDFRKPLKSSPLIEEVKAEYRKLVPYYDKDRVIYGDIQVTVDFMRGLKL